MCDPSNSISVLFQDLRRYLRTTQNILVSILYSDIFLLNIIKSLTKRSVFIVWSNSVVSGISIELFLLACFGMAVAQ